MRYFKKLVGDRIFLSPINPDDVETYTQWFNDLETALPLSQAFRTYSLPKEREAVEKLCKEEHQFAIVRQDEGKDRLIGGCGLHEVNLVFRRATLGIFIGDPESRGNGYGSEATMLLLEYGFGLLNLENIMLWVAGYNERAIKCYEKCGFKVIGRRRNANFVNGVAHDAVCMDIIKEEFDRDIRDRLPMYFQGCKDNK